MCDCDFDAVIDREKTCDFKFDLRQKMFGRADVIPMWIADMDFPLPSFVNDAIKKRIEYPHYGYEFLPDGFYQAIIDWQKKRNNWDIERDWIVYLPGVVVGFVIGELAFAEKGDGIVIQPPVYPPFSETINSNERVLINNPLKLIDGHYEVDFEGLDKQLAKAKLMILCNPHNPVGRVYTRDELRRMGELCIKHDVIIIADEIHSDLIFKPNKHIPLASVSPEIAARTITLTAPSKTFNMAELCTSAAIIPNPELRKAYMKKMDQMRVTTCNTFGAAALEAAYKQGEPWLEKLLEYLEGNIKFAKQFIEQKMPRIKVNKVEATYLLWLNFRELGMTHEELQKFLVFEAGLGLNDGKSFGEQEGDCHARMNLATSRKVIEKALNQLLEAYNKL